MSDDTPTPAVLWMTRARAAEVLGRQITDLDCDPTGATHVRSRLTGTSHRQFHAEDVEALAKRERATKPREFETPEQAATRAEVFARWAVDAKARREKIRAALAGVRT